MPKFIEPEHIVAQLDLPKGTIAADFGCGSGFFTIALARAAADQGMVYAVDILQDKLAVTSSNAQHAGFKNVTVVQADLERSIDKVPEASCDIVVVANILHQVTSRENLGRNAYRVLKTGGRLLVVEWKHERTAFGPPVSTRISKSHLLKELEPLGFRFEKDVEADGYHYAAVFIK